MKPMHAISLTLIFLLTLSACGTTFAETDMENAAQFSDVPADSAYADAVAWCQERGIMNGVSNAAFDPNGVLTRAMLASVLYRAEGEPVVSGTPVFTDTQSGIWYANAIVWASERGIVEGYGNGLFEPNTPITREQLAAILWRYDGKKEIAPTSIGDRAAISDYAQTAVDWAVSTEVMSCRTEGGFAPQENATRAEVAVAFYRYLSEEEKDETGMNKITLTFNGHTYTATLEDNSSAKAFGELLKNGSLTIAAHDYGHFEKVGALGTALPQNDQQITTAAGDIILYQGNQITVYYGVNTWSFTRLGRIDNPTDLQENLGDGDVEITFQLSASDALK